VGLLTFSSLNHFPFPETPTQKVHRSQSIQLVTNYDHTHALGTQAQPASPLSPLRNLQLSSSRTATRSTRPRRLHPNSRTRTPMVRILRLRIRRDARTRSSADQRTGAQPALCCPPNAKAEHGAPSSSTRGTPFWQPRYYDFNVWSEDKRIEKLRYIHRNPVRRGLVERPEDWPWSSFRHYVSGVEGPVEIESQWTARKREQMGTEARIVRQNESKNESQSPHPVAKNATRMGHPKKLG